MKTSALFTNFEYLSPKTVEEACSLLSKYKGEAKLMVGGTDLLISVKSREMTPAYVINLEAIPDLNYIQFDADVLRIGALATMHDVASSSIIREKFSALAEAACQMGSPQVRNMATVVGNLCRSAPSADTAPPLLAYGAGVKLVGSSGERVVSLDDFFLGPGENALRNDEILTEVQVPNTPPNTRSVYLRESARAALGIAKVSVAVVVTMDDKYTSITDVKIVLGAVAPTPVRAVKAEDMLGGKAIEEKLIESASEMAMEAAKPISDIRCSAGYRMEMVKVMVNRAIRQVTISA